MTGILNPPVDATVCRQMIAAVREELTQTEMRLTLNLLPHEQYLQTFGRAEMARAVLRHLEKIYDSNFKV